MGLRRRRSLVVAGMIAASGRRDEIGVAERELAVSFPGEVGLVLGLDIDMVLQQDPFDWAAHS